jgi:hypothetical protein
MAESMYARVSARHPANRRPRIPHPHLAQSEREDREEQAVSVEAAPSPPPGSQDSRGWTAVDVPLARPSSRPRRGPTRQPPAERALRSALHAGLFVNLAVLLASRLLPRLFQIDAFGGWSYGGDDFLLAAAVLLSGYALLAVGRISRREDGER